MVRNLIFHTCKGCFILEATYYMGNSQKAGSYLFHGNSQKAGSYLLHGELPERWKLLITWGTARKLEATYYMGNNQKGGSYLLQGEQPESFCIVYKEILSLFKTLKSYFLFLFFTFFFPVDLIDRDYMWHVAHTEYVCTYLGFCRINFIDKQK